MLDSISRVLALNWIRDRDEWTPVAGWAPNRLTELENLAGSGAVYEIEAWIHQARQMDSGSEAWLQSLEAKLALLDFKGIAQLAAARAKEQDV
ncbi:MAG: hypothetical protein ACR2HF_06465 [Methylococcaceae bacterium]